MSKKIIMNVIFTLLFVGGGIVLNMFFKEGKGRAQGEMEYRAQYTAYVVKSARERIQPPPLGGVNATYNNKVPSVYAWQVDVYEGSGQVKKIASETWVVSYFKTLVATSSGPVHGKPELEFQFLGEGKVVYPGSGGSPVEGTELLNNLANIDSFVRQYKAKTIRHDCIDPIGGYPKCFCENDPEKHKVHWIPEDIKDANALRNLIHQDICTDGYEEDFARAFWTIKGVTDTNEYTATELESSGLNNYFIPTEWLIKGTIFE